MKDWGKLEADVNAILNKHYTKGRGGKKVNKVIVHYNAGNLTVEGCYSVWQTREASAHYQVEDGGRIGQLVWDSDTAWHAGNFPANQTSIGIEHANRSDGTISEACLDNGAHLVAAICHYYGLGRPEWLKNVYPHKHFAATSCPGQIYGSQKSAYIKRCQYWYDKMDGKDVEKPSSSTSKPSTSGKPSGALDPKQSILLHDGYFGPLTVRHWQARLRRAGYYPASKYVIDGDFGPKTKLETQYFLRDHGYYPASKYLMDGDFGPESTKALQQYLKDLKCYWNENGWCLVDGDWADLTTIAVQRAVNAGVLFCSGRVSV